jgi:hypothetical protein
MTNDDNSSTRLRVAFYVSISLLLMLKWGDLMSEKAKRLLNRMVTNDIQNLGPTGTLKLAESLVNMDLSYLEQNEELIAEILYEELKAQEKLAPLLQKAIMIKEEEVPLALSLNDLL